MRVGTVSVAACVMLCCLAPFIGSDLSEGAITELGYSLNGNQELLADPTKPIVYWVDTEGTQLHVLNATTQEESWAITVGANATSMDLSSDGRYLYVAVSGESKITVVDLDDRTVSKTIPLSFRPLSIRIGLSGRLYLTDFPEPYTSGGPKVIDESSGTLLEDIAAYGNCVLEMSPDKMVLLMMQLGSSPTKVYKYSCAGPTLSLLDEDNHDLDANARQMAVDWEDEKIYVATVNQEGPEIMSLETMDLEGVLPAYAKAQGITLSPDKETVFCTTTGTEDSLMAFHASNRTLMAKYKLREAGLAIDPSTYAAIAVPPAPCSIAAVGQPPQFINLSTPRPFPGYPRDGEIIGYDYDGPIEADVFAGVPPLTITSGEIELDGEPLTTIVIWNQVLMGNLTEPLSKGGIHIVNARIEWEGGSATTSWTFNSSEEEHIVSISPARSERIEYVPNTIVVTLDLGYPERTYSGGIVLTINGEIPFFEVEDEIITIQTVNEDGNLLMPGLNAVYMRLFFTHVDYMLEESSELIAAWTYEIVNVTAEPATDGLGWYTMDDGTSLKLPLLWDIDENVTVGDSLFDLQAEGPAGEEVAPMITLQKGNDLEVAMDDFLTSFADEFMARMQAAQIDVSLCEGPSYRVISGLDAVVIAIRWYDMPVPIVQKMAVIVNQTSYDYWILIFTSEATQYFEDNPMFEGVLSSLTLGSGGDEQDDENDPGQTDDSLPEITRIAFLGAMVAGIVVLAVFAVVGLGIWDRIKKLQK